MSSCSVLMESEVENLLQTSNAVGIDAGQFIPLPSLFTADVLKQAGLPDGVFNVVQGDQEAVDVAGAPRCEGGELCRLHADCQLHLPDRSSLQQTCTSPGRSQEPHGGDA